MIHGYTKVYALGHRAISELFLDEVLIEEKVDGCFNYNMPILMDDYTTLPIGYIVNNKIKRNVVSYNTKTGKLEGKPIVNWFNNGKTEDWYSVFVRGKITSRKKEIVVTPNHKFYTNNGCKLVKELTTNDRLLVPDFTLNYLAKQLILGFVLGDASLIKKEGSFNNPRYEEAHSVKQREYLDLKRKILGNYFDIAHEDRISQFGYPGTRFRTNCDTRLNALHEICYINGKKRVNERWLSELSLLGIAFWYMDDGSVSFTEKQRPRLRFASEGYTFEENTLLSNFLKNKGYDNSVLHSKKYHYIQLNADSTEKFFFDISCYVPKCMQYKIPENLRMGITFFDMYEENYILQETEILGIQKKKTFKNTFKTKYDIEIADNHNYFANWILVGNSQFSFGSYDGELRCRSHGQQINLNSPDTMFNKAIETAKELFPLLNNGWTYRTEFLQKPKHNVLVYNRVPNKNLIIFDIDKGLEDYVTRENKEAEATRLSLECVPKISYGWCKSIDDFTKLLDRESILGGQKIEGVVVKNYNRFGNDKKILVGKFVNPKYKEEHRLEWKVTTGADIKTEIGKSLGTEPRWQKAVQHLAENGTINSEPQDIPLLLKEINKDVLDECIESIKEQLFKWGWKDISRQITRGFPEWYKQKLAMKQFEEKNG